MKMAVRRWRKLGIAVWAGLGIASIVEAAPQTPSIGINMTSYTGASTGPNSGNADGNSALGANEFGGLPAVRQANFNNVNFTHDQMNMAVDLNGTAVAGANTADLNWTGYGLVGGSGPGGGPGFTANSNQDPNKFNTELGPSEGGTSPGTPPQRPTNYQLYEAYLGTEDNSLHVYDVTNLPPQITANGYDVYVYSMMSAPSRGGTYRMNVPFTVTLFGDPEDDDYLLEFPNGDGIIGVTKKRVQAAVDNTEDFTDFIEDPGFHFADDVRTTAVEETDTGNYMVFRDITGSSFQLTVSTNGEFNADDPDGPQNSDGFAGRDIPPTDSNFRERAGVNFIQIVANPPGGLAGDFNNDAAVNATDIDLLCDRINAGTGSVVPFDVNGDGSVNQADVNFEVTNILDTKFGDTDTDGDVDLNDLGNLASGFNVAGEKRWSRGNFDCDQDVDLNDLGTLATNFGAGRGAALAAFEAMVPEPALGGLLLLGMAVHAGRRRRI
jgi:hypothetical protein